MIFTKWSNQRLVKFDHWSNYKLVKIQTGQIWWLVKFDQSRIWPLVLNIAEYDHSDQFDHFLTSLTNLTSFRIWPASEFDQFQKLTTSKIDNFDIKGVATPL